MHPSELQPIFNQIIPMLTLRQKHILQAINTVRLIKQTLLWADHTFYMFTCIHVLPTLNELIHGKQIHAPNFAMRSLCEIWNTEEQYVTQADTTAYHSYLSLVDQFFKWFDRLIPEHQCQVDEMAGFSSHFSLLCRLNSMENQTNFNFFNEEETAVYRQNYRHRYDNATCDSRINVWEDYCQKTISTYI